MSASSHDRQAFWSTAIIVLALIVLSRPGLAATTFKHLAIDITVEADGTYIQTYHSEATATEGILAQRMGEVTLAFNPSLQQLDILEAYTLKQDGTRKDVEAGAIRAQLPAEVRGAPMFADVRDKVVIFPDLGPGDTRVITYRRRIEHPLFPGQFIWWIDFARNEGWEDVRITINAPSNHKLRTESIGVPGVQTRADSDRTVYSWQYRAEAAPTEVYAVAGIDRRPRVFVSSLPDYAAMAAAYAALAAPKGAVTPAIQAKADAITARIADERGQARALYDWVSKHIRYVGLYLYRGAIEPHPAELVLANGYGDCKDHVTLLAALLAAKGIGSQAVLINLGKAYTLSGPPTLAQLDHVITYIPELDLYADSTLGIAPFGVLLPSEYGKPIVVVGTDGGGTLRRLPMPAADATEFRTGTSASLKPDGEIIGTTVTKGTGPAAIILRYTARAFVGRVQEMANRQLAALGEAGTGDLLEPETGALNPSMVVVGNFTLDPQPELSSGESFTPPRGLAIFAQPGDFLLGPDNFISIPADESVPCFPGHQVEDLSLALPPGRKPERLPVEHRFENGAFTYLSRWTMQGDVLTVHREFTSRIGAPLCEGAVRRAADTMHRLIRRDRQATVALAVGQTAD